ncbi:MAG: hypothetical protein ACMUJM_18750 [bacterium]
MASNEQVIRQVDDAIWGLYGSYIQRPEHLTDPDVVRILGIEEYLRELDTARVLSHEPGLYEHSRAALQEALERMVAAGNPPGLLAEFARAVQRHGIEGLNAERPWLSTGDALVAWQRLCDSRIDILLRMASGRSELNVEEGFTEGAASPTGPTRITAIGESTSGLIGTIAHEAIHFYTSPAYVAAVASTGIDTVPSMPTSATSTEEEEIEKIRSHPNYQAMFRIFLEGMTHYFTLQLRTEMGLEFSMVHTAYDDAVREVARMADVFGEETLRRAYFSGDSIAIGMMGLSMH